MKVKVAQLLEYLKQKEMTVEDFAKKLHLSIDEIEKLLAGKAVGINTARKFISGLSVELAQDLIDWEAIGISNPLANDGEEENDFFDDFEDDDFDDFEDFEDEEYDLADHDSTEEFIKLKDFEDFEAYENFKYSGKYSDDYADDYGEDEENEDDD